MIRVLHVLRIMNHGGAETMLMNIYRNIDRNKFEFDFLCMSNDKGEYDDEIKKLGGKIYRVSSPSKGRIKNLIEIYKLLKKEKFDVIHSHVSFYSGPICLIANWAGIQKRFVHSHTTNDLRKKFFVRKVYNNICKNLIKKYSTEKLACGDMAGKYLYDNEKFEIIKNGIDLEKYLNVSKKEIDDLKEKYNINKNDFVIGNVGRFVKLKNQEYFIKLAKYYKGRNIKVKIVLVGNGERQDEIKCQIKNNGLDDYFVLPGISDEINVFMNMFNVFVMPSLYEGFPLVIVEALAGGNSCYVSKNVSKEVEIIKGKVFFFDINEEVNLLAEKILSEKKIKDNNLEHILIEEGFSIRDMTKRLEKKYI